MPEIRCEANAENKRQGQSQWNNIRERERPSSCRDPLTMYPEFNINGIISVLLVVSVFYVSLSILLEVIY